MALRGKMDHPVKIILCAQAAHKCRIADIALDKMVILSVFHRLQIGRIACIGQGIKIDDGDIITIFFKHIQNKV